MAEVEEPPLPPPDSGVPAVLPFHLAASERPNARFPTFVRTRTITIPRQPLLSPRDVVFTMGSCFAQEIRTALTSRGLNCVPEYNRIEFDPDLAIVDTVPRIQHMNFYNTFAVRQQFEQMFGQWTQESDDYWRVERFSPKVVPWANVPSFQDPYRRLVVARSPDVLRSVVGQIVDEMRRAFEQATAFIFTFGMTEVFINRRSGKVAAQKPGYSGGGGLEDTVRQDSSFEQNLDNVRSLVRMIRERKPDAPIIMSVSPVPLSRTFGPLDVVTASIEGKSILRAVLGQVVREFERVAYLPSYEYVTLLGEAGMNNDLRHVRTDVVADIVGAFFDAFSIPEAERTIEPEAIPEALLTRYAAQIKVLPKEAVDVVIAGDSLVAAWDLQSVRSVFPECGIAKMAMPGDRLEHTLWKVRSGDFDHLQPLAIVLIAGSNNLPLDDPPQVARGLLHLADDIATRWRPEAIFVVGLPSSGEDARRHERVAAVNALLRENSGERPGICFIDLEPVFRPAGGAAFRDRLEHLSPAGYQLLANVVGAAWQAFIEENGGLRVLRARLARGRISRQAVEPDVA